VQAEQDLKVVAVEVTEQVALMGIVIQEQQKQTVSVTQQSQVEVVPMEMRQTHQLDTAEVVAVVQQQVQRLMRFFDHASQT
jgi:outer membrane lipopolysaccharide assembly protein LptE/RlpB